MPGANRPAVRPVNGGKRTASALAPPPGGHPTRAVMATALSQCCTDNAGMTQLIVIRHGETDWNRQHRFQGQIDVPLNALGLEQARRLGQRLAAEWRDGPVVGPIGPISLIGPISPIGALVVSDLQRARQTAQPLADTLGRPAQVQPLWREQGFGILEGLDVPTIRSRHAGLWAQWLRHDADYALPQGGESNTAFHGRVMQALQAVLASPAGQAGGPVVVVTHGGVLDMLWRTVHGLSLTGPRECEIPNTGINRLRWTDGRLGIDGWADVAHLDGLPAQPSTVQARVPTALPTSLLPVDPDSAAQ